MVNRKLPIKPAFEVAGKSTLQLQGRDTVLGLPSNQWVLTELLIIVAIGFSRCFAR